jgi:hypothetical protein
MKTPKTFLLSGVMLGIALLFSQCRQVDETDQQIAYNKENAQVHIIPMTTAAQLTSTFRKGRVELARQLKDTAFLNSNFNMPLAEEFNRDAMAALLNQKGAKGVRIYLGQDAKGLIRLVLVAVDDKGNDITGNKGKIMKYSSYATEDDDAVALESGQRCPTLCSLTGSLDQ